MATQVFLMSKDSYDSITEKTPRFYFDSLTGFQPVFSQTLTRYGISDNSSISNHVIKNPTTIQITGKISTAPLHAKTNSIVGDDSSSFSARPYNAINLMYNWKDNKTLLYCEDQYFSYPNYLITDLRPIYKAEDAVTMQITLQEVKYVGYQRVTLIKNATDAVKKDGASSTSANAKTITLDKYVLGTYLSNLGNLFTGGADSVSLTDGTE